MEAGYLVILVLAFLAVGALSVHTVRRIFTGQR
jgi:hypothetical protein